MYRFIKRFLDILFSLAALPFVLLVFIFIAPVIFFTDRGPVFYNATRRGKDGKKFKMYKFRSMRVNAPDIRNSDGSTYNGDNDPRTTKIGRFMRKTSIDELPQFLNVFKGDMSFIGPRPVLAGKPLDMLSDAERKRLTLRPGITGYSQAYFRNSISMEEKTANDCYYVDNISFLLDVKILFRTIISVFKHENIYVKPQVPTDAASDKQEK